MLPQNMQVWLALVLFHLLDKANRSYPPCGRTPNLALIHLLACIYWLMLSSKVRAIPPQVTKGFFTVQFFFPPSTHCSLFFLVVSWLLFLFRYLHLFLPHVFVDERDIFAAKSLLPLSIISVSWRPSTPPSHAKYFSSPKCRRKSMSPTTRYDYCHWCLSIWWLPSCCVYCTEDAM